ncbi:PepSY-associated TM helix domain-containing protein [Colwellia asteriadis]|uniref:PepSY-associated TM helix domain-containing protein n=1 Tax=Colwellia asteriadis TaxID=517723 RepID=A0ABN1LAQ6_9GAMM
MKIRSDILRTYQSLHTWTGIIAGLVLFIGFYAGSLTMFKTELTQWATPDNYKLAQIPTDKFDALVLKASEDFGKAQQNFTLNFSAEKSPMTWYENGGERGLQLNDTLRHVTLSENDELISQVSPVNELGELIDMLHRTAGIAGKVGHEDLGVLVLGVASVLYFIALVSGVIFLLPTLTKSFFALRKTKNASRFWLDSHNLVGVISLPFHLIIAWTVVVFAFHDMFYGGLSIIYGDKPLFERGKEAAIEYNIKALPSVTAYQNKIEEISDGYHVTSLSFSNLHSKSPSVAVYIVNQSELMRSNMGDVIYMNPYTLEVQYSSIQLSDDDIYTPAVISFFALHFGSYGGDWGRWLYFILGLLGAFLFYSGNLLWLEKRRQKRTEQTKSVHLMASLTIGICLGSLLAVATTLLLSRWFYLISPMVNPYYMGCYYTVFFGALCYSFYRGAALSAIHLLYTLALICLLIPVTTLLTTLWSSIALWEFSNMTSILINITASIFALLFYIAARKAAIRAYHGERESIWALTA